MNLELLCASLMQLNNYELSHILLYAVLILNECNVKSYKTRFIILVLLITDMIVVLSHGSIREVSK